MAFNSQVQTLFNQQSQQGNKGIFDLVGSGQIGMNDVVDTIGQDKVDWYMKQNKLNLPQGGGLATQGLTSTLPQNNFQPSPAQPPAQQIAATPAATAPQGNFSPQQYTPTDLTSNFNPTKYPTPIPPTPQYWNAAGQQGNENLSAARNTVALSNPDVMNTYGSQTMTTGPDGRPVLNQNLSPEMQARLNALNSMLPDATGRIQSELNNPLRSYITQDLGAPSYSDLNKVTTPTDMQGYGDIYQQLRNRLPTQGNLPQVTTPADLQGFGDIYRQIRNRLPTADETQPRQITAPTGTKGLEDLYRGIKGYLPDTSNASLSARTVNPDVASQEMVTEAMRNREAPRLQRDRTQIENQLKIKGINPGTEAWNNAMMDVERKENDFQLGLLAMSGQEQNRRFGLESDLRKQQGDELNDWYNREMGVGQFASGVQSNLFGMDASLRGMQGQELNDLFNRELGVGQFAGDTQSRLFGMESGARSQAEQELNNLFSREMGVGQFAGDTQSRLFNLESGLRGQQRDEVNDLYGLQSNRRNQQIAEGQLLRGLPIQEYASLIQAMQPSLPQFQSYTGAQVDAAPYFNATNAQGLFDLSRYGTMIEGELGTRGADANKKQGNYDIALRALGL